MPSSSLETAFSQTLAKQHPGFFTAMTREHTFALPRRWRFDFAWIDLKIAVEVDGLYGTSRHRSVKGFVGDCDKLNRAAELGWTVLRFTSKHINADVGACVDMVARVIQSRLPVVTPVSTSVEN